MTSIRRNQVLNRYRSDAPSLGKGGSGRSPGTRSVSATEDRLRYPADPAAELMPAAEFLGHEPDFPAILESFEGSPFDPARRAILGRLMGVFAMDYQGARSEERRYLKRLLGTRNAREGYAANRALHLCSCHHAIRRTLALGVAESRMSHGPIRGFLGAVQARVAATTFGLLGPRSRSKMWSLLTLAGTGDDGALLKSADPVIERALILKSLAARRDQVGPWSSDGFQAIEEVAKFSLEIRGSTFENMAAATTLEPVDESRQHPSARDPRAFIDRARAEVDPIFAWERNGRRREVIAGAAPMAEPWEVLGDIDRSPLRERPRIHQALAEARATPEHVMTAPLREVLAAFLTGGDVVNPKQLDAAFQVLDEHAFDLADRKAVSAIREDAQGIYRFDAARALSALLSRYTGATYVRRVFSDQLTAGSDPLGEIASSLDSGMSVPMAVQELRKDRFRAFSVLQSAPVPGSRRDYKMRVAEPGGALDALVFGSMLLQPELPDAFGKKMRADAYLAPAALDLLAPPFGLVFSELGIEDEL